MTSLKPSNRAVSWRPIVAETTVATPSRAAKRPWYTWLCALAAALIGLYYLYYLAITPATNGLAFVWLAALVASSFIPTSFLAVR